jgi:cytochrome b involved in lipid metabolism
MSEPRVISEKELAKHNTADDAWIKVGAKVFDVSTFKYAHPGGELILSRYAGKDATEQFHALHRSEVGTDVHYLECAHSCSHHTLALGI